jgi:hypothetical protein
MTVALPFQVSQHAAQDVDQLSLDHLLIEDDMHLPLMGSYLSHPNHEQRRGAGDRQAPGPALHLGGIQGFQVSSCHHHAPGRESAGRSLPLGQAGGPAPALPDSPL